MERPCGLPVALAMQDDPHSVGDILDSLASLGAARDQVAVDDIVQRFGQRGHGPMLLVPALIEISPIGAIPGLPSFLALIIAITAMQMLLGRRHLRLPGFLARRHVAGAKLAGAARKLGGVGRFLDRHFHGRLRWLTGAPWRRAAAAVILALCCTVPPLELLPFASTAPMAAIAAFGLALLVRDGALMLAALALSLGAAGLGVSLFLGR